MKNWPIYGRYGHIPGTGGQSHTCSPGRLQGHLWVILTIGSCFHRQKAEKASQAKIDQMDEQTSVIISEFKTVSKQIEGLRVYNAQMRFQIQRQEDRLKEI